MFVGSPLICCDFVLNENNQFSDAKIGDLSIQETVGASRIYEVSIVIFRS